MARGGGLSNPDHEKDNIPRCPEDVKLSRGNNLTPQEAGFFFWFFLGKVCRSIYLPRAGDDTTTTRGFLSPPPPSCWTPCLDREALKGGGQPGQWIGEALGTPREEKLMARWWRRAEPAAEVRHRRRPSGEDREEGGGTRQVALTEQGGACDGLGLKKQKKTNGALWGQKRGPRGRGLRSAPSEA